MSEITVIKTQTEVKKETSARRSQKIYILKQIFKAFFSFYIRSHRRYPQRRPFLVDNVNEGLFRFQIRCDFDRRLFDDSFELFVGRRREEAGQLDAFLEEARVCERCSNNVRYDGCEREIVSPTKRIPQRPARLASTVLFEQQIIPEKSR